MPIIHSPNTPKPVRPGVAFPSDLRLWLGEDHLLRVVLEAAAQHAGGCVAARDMGRGDGSLTATQMVALTVFSHLTGRYGSEAIAEELESDPALRYLCAGRFPSATALRRFRRWYRPVLAAALRGALEVAAESRMAHAWIGYAAGWRSVAGGQLPAWVGDACREAAEARLSRAALADTMALDC
jgi:hypothetical protein